MALAGDHPQSKLKGCTYRGEDAAIMNFELDELPSFVRTMNRHGANDPHRDSLVIAPRPSLSGRVSYFPGGDELILSDYLTTLSYRILLGDTCARSVDLDLDGMLKLPLLLLKGVDTAYYRAHHDYLVGLGFGQVTLGCASFSGDTTTMIVSAGVPIRNDTTSEIGLSGIDALVRMVNDQILSLTLIDPVIPGEASYMFPMADGLFYAGGELTQRLLKRSTGTGAPVELLGTLVEKDSMWSFESFPGLLRPGFYDLLGQGAGMTIGVFNGGLYNMKHYPLVFDMSRHRTYDLRSELESMGYGTLDFTSPQTYYCYDAHRLSSEYAEIVFRAGGENHLAIIDLNSSRIMAIHPIDLNGLDKDSIRFLINGKLVGLSTDRAWVVVM